MHNQTFFMQSCFQGLFASEHVSWPVTALFGGVLVALILCLALEEKLHAKKSLIAGVFAIICLLLGSITGVLSFEKVLVGSKEVVPAAEEIEVMPMEDSDQTEPILIHRMPDGSKKAAKEDADKRTDPEEEPEEHHLFLDGEQVSMPVYIPGIDWGVIAIIFGSSLFVDVASTSGLFS